MYSVADLGFLLTPTVYTLHSIVRKMYTVSGVGYGGCVCYDIGMFPAVLLTLIVVGFLMGLVAIFKFVPKDHTKSISHHAASSRRTYWILALSLVLAGVPTYYLLWKWFMPTLELPAWFAGVLAVGFVCLMVTAFVPDKPGAKHRMHWLGAYGVGLTMIAIMASVLVAGQVSAPARLLAAQFVATGIVFLVLAFTSAWCRKRYLYFQSFIIINWVLVLLLIAYLQ